MVSVFLGRIYVEGRQYVFHLSLCIADIGNTLKKEEKAQVSSSIMFLQNHAMTKISYVMLNFNWKKLHKLPSCSSQNLAAQE